MFQHVRLVWRSGVRCQRSLSTVTLDSYSNRSGPAGGCRDSTRKGKMMVQELSPAAQMVGDVAPKLVELTDDVLFGDVWEREGLSKRDRSLATVAALVAMYRSNELPSHLRRALENGVTREELVEAITHLAFYAGWPCAMTAMKA